ncbi:MAG: metallophosphoesterase family protein [Acidobacteriaceae bacterium]|nr:metallophosphoesterase family protein [Acidobacteriaceae bacterium]
MKVAVLSDIHDNLWNLAPAIEAVTHADTLICCGDLCSPFVVDELAKFPRDIHIVFGNNDADLFRITAKAGKKRNCHVHGELFECELDGRRFGVNHFDYLAPPMSKSGNYDVFCFGHNHEFEISKQGPCVLINPGPIMGAKFSTGAWQDTTPTFVIYDTTSNQAAAYRIDVSTKRVVALDGSR